MKAKCAPLFSSLAFSHFWHASFFLELHTEKCMHMHLLTTTKVTIIYNAHTHTHTVAGDASNIHAILVSFYLSFIFNLNRCIHTNRERKKEEKRMKGVSERDEERRRKKKKRNGQMQNYTQWQGSLEQLQLLLAFFLVSMFSSFSLFAFFLHLLFFYLCIYCTLSDC